jgi:hypothetical protein
LETGTNKNGQDGKRQFPGKDKTIASYQKSVGVATAKD